MVKRDPSYFLWPALLPTCPTLHCRDFLPPAKAARVKAYQVWLTWRPSTSSFNLPYSVRKVRTRRSTRIYYLHRPRFVLLQTSWILKQASSSQVRGVGGPTEWVAICFPLNSKWVSVKRPRRPVPLGRTLSLARKSKPIHHSSFNFCCFGVRTI